jgi:hypothetical protein
MARRVSFNRIGFMLVAFLLPGLIGPFASFSIPAPVVDVVHQEAALDAVQAAATPAEKASAFARLGSAVDADTAAIVTRGTGTLEARIAAARATVLRNAVGEAKAAAFRIRLMVITMTVLGAMFGVALLTPSEQG